MVALGARGLFVIVITGLTLFASLAAADERWWDTGHEHITRGAITHLPQPLRSFFQANADAVIAGSGVEPPGAHYIDIDYYPEFFQGTLPHDLNQLVALYGWTIVNDNGIGPWTAAAYADTLTGQMAGAHTAQAWLNLLPTAAPLAHYIEDLHNPLHLTMNYNGQLTGNTGVHSRYEGQMISRHLPGDLAITPAPQNCVYYPSLVDAIFDSIDVNYWFVDDIMQADTLARGTPPHYAEPYYTAMWGYTGGFTHTLFQQASEMLASAWYTAWVDAGSPPPLLTAYGDVNCDGFVNFDDINPFVTAVTSAQAYEAAFPTCPWLSADCNSDGDVNFDDISPFIGLLSAD